MANDQDMTKMINEGKFKKHKETEKTFHIASLGMESQRESICRGLIFIFHKEGKEKSERILRQSRI